MPVECAVEVRRMEQDEFHSRDKQIMRHAFDIHNSMGRFFDEKIYQEELAQRCRESGLDVQREVPIRVVHHGFEKLYYMDMLVDGGAVYELKTVERLIGNHTSQLIHYLLLAELGHGKLVNFGPRSVKSRFVSTKLHRRDRLNFNIDDSSWHASDEASRRLHDALVAILSDWGAFLDRALYREAILHLLHGAKTGVHSVAIESSGRSIGRQEMCLLDPETAWHLSTIRTELKSYETHTVRLLNHTPLQRIQWINLNHRNILLKTLSK